jgi:hypothetical protein
VQTQNRLHKAVPEKNNFFVLPLREINSACGKLADSCGILCGKPWENSALPVEYFLKFHRLWKTSSIYSQVFHRH